MFMHVCLARLVLLVSYGLHVVKSSLSTLGVAFWIGSGRAHLDHRRLAVYTVVYAGFATSGTLTALLAWFFIYGVHFALVEGSEKALNTEPTPKELQGHAFIRATLCSASARSRQAFCSAQSGRFSDPRRRLPPAPRSPSPPRRSLPQTGRSLTAFA